MQLDGGTQWRYFEPIRPGDRITQYRKITDVYERQGSAGPLIFIIGHSRFVNQFDETAVKMTGVSIRYEPGSPTNNAQSAKPGNGRTAADAENSYATPIESLDWDGVSEGAEIGPFIKHTTTQDLVKYAGASRDFSEIHYDKDFALGVGLPGVILHGALKAAYLGQTDDRLARRSQRAQVAAMPAPRHGLPVGVGHLPGARVARKYVEDGQSLADCEISIENTQRTNNSPGPGHHIPTVIMTTPTDSTPAVPANISFKQEPDHWTLK